MAGWNGELDEMRRLRDNSSAVFAELAAEYRQQTGVPNLKIVLFKGDQHVIEVPKSCQLSNEGNFCECEIVYFANNHYFSMFYMSFLFIIIRLVIISVSAFDAD